jgi:predicted PurR-regulated permease PerM
MMNKSIKLVSQLPRWVTWGLAIPLIVLNGWVILVVFNYFQSLITIFITANLLAFILNYPVEWLIFRGFKRNRAILIVGLLTILLLIILGLTLAPAVIGQLNEFLLRLPSWIESGSQQIQSFNALAEERNLPLDFSVLTTQLTQRLSDQLQSLAGQTLSFVLGTVGSVVTIILILVLTFYLLLQGQELWDGIYEWLPPSFGSVMGQLLRQNFQNYYIGQASLAAMIGTVMTVAFIWLQIPFALLFGLGVGFMALFPFGVSISISVVSLLVALKSFWLGLQVLGVSIIIQQVIENGLAPRLLGGFTGLNPVWILVALLIGTQVGGILGLLIAVPVAGFIKSLTNVLHNPPTHVENQLETETAIVTEET